MNEHTEINTKEHIRETAIRLFQEYGFDHVTIMQICEACKITKRTFYYHFKSKHDVLTGLMDVLGIKAERLLTTFTSQKNNIETLWVVMSVYCENSQTYGHHIIKQLYLKSLEEKNDVHFPEDMYLYPIVVQLIKNAKVNHEISNPSSPEDIAFALYHALRSVSITWAFEGGEYDLTSRFKRAFLAILNYMDNLS